MKKRLGTRLCRGQTDVVLMRVGRFPAFFENLDFGQHEIGIYIDENLMGLLVLVQVLAEESVDGFLVGVRAFRVGCYEQQDES